LQSYHCWAIATSDHAGLALAQTFAIIVMVRCNQLWASQPGHYHWRACSGKYRQW